MAGGHHGKSTKALKEEVRDGLLIRESPQYTYYNKIARLNNWQGNLLGGHQAPPSDLVSASV